MRYFRKKLGRCAACKDREKPPCRVSSRRHHRFSEPGALTGRPRCRQASSPVAILHSLPRSVGRAFAAFLAAVRHVLVRGRWWPSLQEKPVCKKNVAVCKLASGRTRRVGKGLCRREARVCRNGCMARPGDSEDHNPRVVRGRWWPSLQEKPVCKKNVAVCKLAGGRTRRAGNGLCRREARVCRNGSSAAEPPKSRKIEGRKMVGLASPGGSAEVSALCVSYCGSSCSGKVFSRIFAACANLAA